MEKAFVLLMLSSALVIQSAQADKPKFKICVPRRVLPACNELMKSESDAAEIECVAGRDRVDCLDIVEQRKADFMAADPEDLYLAFKKKNEDYQVFADIRTLEEQQAEFRYEGIILIKKNSGINSLSDLRGKKSCHTGYGRNVGYKIPIAKLKKHNVFKVDPDITLSPVERELKALSDFFNQSCLVGSYSKNPDVDAHLKKTYANLCALCQHPDKCNYPDDYSGYGGSIKCLIDNGGDVAFTKVIFVNRHFGLPIGHAKVATTTPQANADDFEYLCEDGTKKPITGKACTWAQRPWQAYVGNGDIGGKQLANLQQRLKAFYEEAKLADPKFKDQTKQMMIEPNNTVVAKDTNILPGHHLANAQYTDVIERQLLDDGSSNDEKLKLCVSSNVEMKKCEALKDVAFSRDVRPNFLCVLKDKTGCEKALRDGDVDVVVVQAKDYELFSNGDTKPLLFESFDADNKYVVLADSEADKTSETIAFDSSNRRSVDAALHFLGTRQKGQGVKACPNNIKSDPDAKLKVVNSKDLKGLEAEGKVLVCPDLSTKPLAEFSTCNFDATLPAAVFVNKTIKTHRADAVKHAFVALSEKFGHKSKFEDVFELFGEFEEDQPNILFDDEAAKFVTEPDTTVDEKFYRKLRCLN